MIPFMFTAPSKILVHKSENDREKLNSYAVNVHLTTLITHHYRITPSAFYQVAISSSVRSCYSVHQFPFPILLGWPDMLAHFLQFPLKILVMRIAVLLHRGITYVYISVKAYTYTTMPRTNMKLQSRYNKIVQIEFCSLCFYYNRQKLDMESAISDGRLQSHLLFCQDGPCSNHQDFYH